MKVFIKPQDWPHLIGNGIHDLVHQFGKGVVYVSFDYISEATLILFQFEPVQGITYLPPICSSVFIYIKNHRSVVILTMVVALLISFSLNDFLMDIQVHVVINFVAVKGGY